MNDNDKLTLAVAKAIYWSMEDLDGDDEPPSWENTSNRTRAFCKLHAKAAIKAYELEKAKIAMDLP